MKASMNTFLFFICLITINSVIYPQATYLNESKSELSESYDEFDSLADTLSEKGMMPQSPQELSKTTIWLRKIGGALFMKYVGIKQRLHKIAESFCINKIHIKNYPQSIYYLIADY